MKNKLLIAIASLAILACKQDVKKDFVTFSGKITNKNSDKVTILDERSGYKKEISVAQDGTFKDTLKVEKGFYTLFDGAEYAALYLENGDDISMTINAKEFDETIKFSGKGHEESKFLSESTLKQEIFFNDKSIFRLPKSEFQEKLNNYVSEFNNRLKSGEKELDSSFVVLQKTTINEFNGYAEAMYEEQSYITQTLGKGKPSPKFINYENFKGGETSLDDLKGKYVYIDVWATWCKPCKDEIPALKKLAEDFKGKNIEFVSISVDDKRDYDTWKKMVEEKQLSGVQLYSNKDLKFMKDYKISSIPRFILLDPEGNIVDAQAPRPSQPEIVTVFNSLK